MIAKLRPILKRIAAESEQNSRKRLCYNTNLRWSAIRTGTTISDSADRGSKPHELSWIKALMEKSDLLGLAMFEVLLRRRGRIRWQWLVCDRGGRIIMRGGGFPAGSQIQSQASPVSAAPDHPQGQFLTQPGARASLC